MEADRPDSAKGEGSVPAPHKVFISYNRKDTQWLERLQVHLKPIGRKGIIDLWDDTRIPMGSRWEDVIKQALENARVAVALVSADFLASDFIIEYELPTLLKRVEAEGTLIIPVIVSPCLFIQSDLGVFQAANDPHQPLSALTASESEAVLVKVAKTVARRLAGTDTKGQAYNAGFGNAASMPKAESIQKT